MSHLVSRTYYWLTERLYNEFAWFYDTASWLVSLGRWDSWRRCGLDFQVGVKVLEIGFGTGELLLEMARRSIQVVGLDSSAAMQRITRRKSLNLGFRVPCILGKVSRMPFADGVFDTIVSTFPAEFIFDPATWQEVARLMCNAESASQTVRGRFVVIGLLAIRTGRLRCPGVSSSSQNTRDEVLARIYQLAQAAGLDCRIEIRSFPGHDLPILIAEKSK